MVSNKEKFTETLTSIMFGTNDVSGWENTNKNKIQSVITYPTYYESNIGSIHYHWPTKNWEDLKDYIDRPLDRLKGCIGR